MNGILQIIIEVFGVILPIFIVIGVGFLIRKKGFLKEDHIPVLNKLTYNLGLSTLVFIEISQSKFSDIFNAGSIKVIYSSYFSYIFIIFCFIYFSKINKRLKGAIIVSSFRNNMAFIGMPIAIYALGSLAAAKAAIVIVTVLPLNVILTFIFLQFIDSGTHQQQKMAVVPGDGIYLKQQNRFIEDTDRDIRISDSKGTIISRNNENNTGYSRGIGSGGNHNTHLPDTGNRVWGYIRLILKSIFTDPVIIATAAGLLVSYFNLKLPQPINNVFDIFSNIAVPLALLSIGASFKFSRIKKSLNYLILINILKLIIFPAVNLFFCFYVFDISQLDRTVICLMFATPVAVATFIQSVKFETDHDFISSSIVTTTIVSALTLAVWLFVLKLI